LFYTVQPWGGAVGLWYSRKLRRWVDIDREETCGGLSIPQEPIWKFRKATRSARRLAQMMREKGVGGEVLLSRWFLKGGRRVIQDFIIAVGEPSAPDDQTDSRESLPDEEAGRCRSGAGEA